MDKIDRQIVALLRSSARTSFQAIGQRVALSAPAVKRRVDRLEADGVIRSYSAVVDHPEVAAAYTVAGEASAILHVHARDTAHLEEALERIRDTPGIIRTQTQVVL